jgi:GT2 family glycosyltransferase
MVSVIVSFYERTEHLFRCLDALELNKGSFDEVVIADDGSKAETVEKVKAAIPSYSYPITHAWRESNQFEVAATRNHGIRTAKGDYLVFLDCDFLVMPDTIQAHVALAQKNRFVAGDCKYLSEPSTAGLFARAELTSDYLNILYADESDERLKKMEMRFLRRNLLMRLNLASHKKQRLGGHMSIHREDIERVNGYDENFTGWGGEDEDIGRRLVGAGIYCIPAHTKLRLMHMWHPKELGDKDWSEGQNMEYYTRKNVPFRCENGLFKQA